MNIEELKEKASNGDINAMNELARCYAKGIGTSVDYKTASSYSHQAANLGSPVAMVNLAICYSKGIYGEKRILRKLLICFTMLLVKEIVFASPFFTI